MEKINLGKSTLPASRIAYGCWRIAGNSEGPEVTPEREEHGRKAVMAAFESGYTLFDLADIYGGGHCERIFGQVLKEVSGMRDRVLIATKCGIRKHGDPAPDSPYRYDSSAGHIIFSCEQSLRRLGVERVDVFQIHRPDFLANPEEIAAAFSRLRLAGKVREFGVSNFTPGQVTTLQKACNFPLVVNQVEISAMHLNSFSDGTLDQCLTEHITPMAWSPLAGGRLGASDSINLRDPDHARRMHVREVLDSIGRAHEKTRSVVALAWLLKHPAKIIPIVGSTDPGRIQELIKAGDVDLSRDEWYRLYEAGFGHRLP